MSYTTLNGNSESIFSVDNSWDQLLLPSLMGCVQRTLSFPMTRYAGS